MNTKWVRGIAVAAGLAVASVVRAGTVVSSGSGNWENSGTWTGGVPDENSDVFIQAGHTVTMNGLTTRTVNSLSITGVLTHSANSAVPATHKIVLDIESGLTIPAGGRIDVQSKGYTAGNGPGFHTGYASMKGGAHGGQGRGYDDDGWHNDVQLATGNTYGSAKAPTDHGSGGSVSAGGGVVILNVGGQTSLDGTIVADGFSGNRPGAGGSIFLTTGTLVGSGTNSVKGHCTGSTAGGGGGRIAVVVTNGVDTGAVVMQAWGGYNPATGLAGPYPAAAGTIFIKTVADSYGRLIVDNNGTSILGAPSFTGLNDDDPTDGLVTTNMFDAIVVTNSGLLFVGTNCVLDLSNNPQIVCDSSSRLYFGGQGEGGEWLFPSSFTFTNAHIAQLGTNQAVWRTDLTLGTNAVLSHEHHPSPGTAPLTYLTMRNRLNLRIAGDLTVISSGAIDVSAKGYGVRRGLGYGPTMSITTGAYGGEGRGYNGSAVVPSGTPYGSVAIPVDLGSGGAGGRGGGAAILHVDGTATIAGEILSNAQGPGTGQTGSGGSIFLTAGELAGDGTLQATSYGQPGGGGGGGGRIAVVLTNGTSFGNVSFDAQGGAGGGYNAAGGTVYLRHAGQSHGTLVLDNHALATTSMTRLSSNVTDAVVGTVDIRANGKLHVDAGQTLAVYGSWTNAGAFSAGSGGTVELAGTDTATLVGNTTFSRLVCTTAVKRVEFKAGDTFTIASGAGNGLLLAGTPGATNVLASTVANSQWYLTLQSGAAQSVSYVAVSDSNANGGDPVATLNCRDDGNNPNWNFAVPGPIVWTGALDTDWGKGGNWDLARTPIPSDTEVVISNVANQPVLDANRTIDNDLVVQSGANLTCGGWNLTVKGDTTIAGTLTATGVETLTFEGDVNFTGGDFVRAQSKVRIAGTATQVFTAAGEAFNTLEIVNGTVTLNDGLSANYLLCDTAGAVIHFQNGQTIAVTDLRLTGATGNRISLRSTSDGSQWNLNVSGRQSVLQVDVKDSNANGGNMIYPMLSASGGNNANWDFTDWEVWSGGTSGDFADFNNWAGLSVPGANSYVLIDGSGANAPIISSPVTIRRLTLGTTQSSTLLVNTNLTVTEDLLVQGLGTITHSANPAGTTEPYKAHLSVDGDLVVMPGGKIDVSGKGFPLRNGPGYQLVSGGTPLTAGAYGGQGEGYDADSSTVIAVGKCYGSFLAPFNLGSGGYSFAGGGAVRLNVDGVLDLRGKILAEDDPASGGNRTGSGGSVWITAGTLSGTGLVSVASDGAPGAGAGGGGRISVTLTGGSDFGAVRFSTNGGSNGYFAASGTLYLKAAGESSGRLIVDNETVLYRTSKTEIPATTNAVTDELRYTALVFTNTAAILITASSRAQSLDLASVDARLDLGEVDTVLSITDDMSINGVVYLQRGLYTLANNWNNQPGGVPTNVAGTGTVELWRPPGSLFLLR